MIKDDIRLANFDINRITGIKQRQKAIKWWNDRLKNKDERVSFDTNGRFYLTGEIEMSSLRTEVFDEQCEVCGFDIEMGSFILLNNDDSIDKLVCMDCYEESLKK